MKGLSQQTNKETLAFDEMRAIEYAKAVKNFGQEARF